MVLEEKELWADIWSRKCASRVPSSEHLLGGASLVTVSSTQARLCHSLHAKPGSLGAAAYQ